MESKSGGFYKGTAGLHKRKADDEIASDKEKTRKLSDTKSVAKPVPTVKNETSATPKPGSNAIVPSATAPKPGSYKALLAKAQATHEAQKAKNPKGGVRNVNYRELQEKRKEEARLAAKAKANAKLNANAKASTSSKPSTTNLSEKNKPGHVSTQKSESAPQPAYKGTAGLGRTASVRSLVGKPSRLARQPPRRPQDYGRDADEEEDDVEEEEEWDSESDDMEAGMGDIDEEEEAALLAAQLEDKKEAELEKRLKEEKEARKKKLHR